MSRCAPGDLAVRGAGVRREGRVEDGLGSLLGDDLLRHAGPQLTQVGAQIVELVNRQVTEGTLPALLGVVVVHHGFPAHGDELAAQAAGL